MTKSQSLMILQENQTIQMEIREVIKVVLTFCLFFILCIFQLIDNSPKINQLSKDGVKVAYPYYNKETKQADLNSDHIYRRKLNWWVQDLADITIPIILLSILLIKPNLSVLGFDLSYMWLFYLVLIAIDRVLFLGKLPFGFIMEVFVCCIQLLYTAYCYYLYYSSKQVET